MVTVIVSDSTEGDDNTSSLGKGCCRGRPHVLKQTLLRLSEPQFLIVLGHAVHILWGSVTQVQSGRCAQSKLPQSQLDKRMALDSL